MYIFLVTNNLEATSKLMKRFYLKTYNFSVFNLLEKDFLIFRSDNVAFNPPQALEKDTYLFTKALDLVCF